MSKLFIAIYDRFERHPRLFWTILALSVALCAVMAAHVRFDENIASFFDGGSEKQNAVFANLKAKDKIIVVVSGDDADEMIDAADVFVEKMQPAFDEGLAGSITEGVDEESIDRCIEFVYEHLPIFIDERKYAELESLITDEGLADAADYAWSLLTSASGMVVGNVVMQDPLGIGSGIISGFTRFEQGMQYEIYGGRIFTGDMSAMLMFIDPAFGMGNTGDNDRLVTCLEEAAREAGTETVKIDCFGAPVIAVCNARQIKHDTTVTLSLALAVILLVILLSFRNRRSIPLIVIPPAFGGLFALAGVWLVQGSISAIAVGAGAVVLGISLSYSIHIISHLNHTTDPHRIIEDLASPLTIGCLTTIGAFAALIFTSSALLRDIGLFSVFTLIGTTLFCLIFLPHFIKNFNNGKRSRLLDLIERGNGYSYESNRWVLGIIAAATAVSLFFWNDVEFDDDMSNINFMPENMVEAEARIEGVMGEGENEIFMVTAADDIEGVAKAYAELCSLLDGLESEGRIDGYTAVADLVIPPSEQQRRIDRWNRFWAEHRDHTLARFESEAVKRGFRAGAFARFSELLNREYGVFDYSADEMSQMPLLAEWVDDTGSSRTLISRLRIDDAQKDEVYDAIDSLDTTVIVDRAWFSSRMTENTVDDFNYILLVSSLMVFIALLASYGRLELTLMTFLPMCISWVIILGFMAVCGIKFNVVNIILATFIFGIGDDFSIFIMDGLLQEYRDGQRLLGAHKTAIFFSAFTAVVGMGVLIFAQHPALKSIALISVLGLCVVVLVSYTVQPLLFRLFVSSQTSRGGFPYTLLSLLNTVYCFVYFLAGCLIVQLYILLLMPLPVSRRKKKASVHAMMYHFTRFFLSTMISARTVRSNPFGETYEKPAVIIANHQSFIDILLLLSLSPNIVMVTNSWVWRSPFFGRIVRYADFHYSGDGYERLAEQLRERVAEGYSVVIFPEGTRSADCRTGRFHKGAFWLAENLRLDILPIILYGTGQVSSKTQGFYIKRGIVVARTMKRVPFGDVSFGADYREQAKAYRRWFAERYRELNDEYGRASNPYFRDALIKNYVYKGPVLEWYMRVKCRLDGWYDIWDRTVPRDAAVVDVGCGYGQLCFMLAMLSPERKVTGVDYDGEKIALARHSFLCRGNVSFECADMRTAELPQADVFIFNDSLHYVDATAQRRVLLEAAAKLRDGGMIIVRDGDASDSKGQRKVEMNEVWSTEIMKFNKTSGRLDFTDAASMRAFAEENGLSLHTDKCGRDTSETIYIFGKR